MKSKKASSITSSAVVSLLALTLVAGCATPPAAGDKEAQAEWVQTNDPAEPTNRNLHAFNQGIDDNVLKPMAEGYRDYVPANFRTNIRNVLTNLSEPLVAANDLLQGEFLRAANAIGRFCVNSTFGFLGMGDVAGGGGLEHHDEDFGQTLAVWGVGEGPYIVLPLLGPSNPRDAVGTAVDFVGNPTNWFIPGLPLAASVGKGTVTAVDKREKYLEPLNEVQRTSLDYYASLRSLYRQKRADDIRNGKKGPTMPAPGLAAMDAESTKAAH
ncbi:MAG: VacJ family lipoprotein [Alphaproteobacteria bacterium]|nr:VacJ family lipoprotein [Alphaproteobacteria bacterium]